MNAEMTAAKKGALSRSLRMDIVARIVRQHHDQLKRTSKAEIVDELTYAALHSLVYQYQPELAKRGFHLGYKFEDELSSGPFDWTLQRDIELLDRMNLLFNHDIPKNAGFSHSIGPTSFGRRVERNKFSLFRNRNGHSVAELNRALQDARVAVQ